MGSVVETGMLSLNLLLGGPFYTALSLRHTLTDAP